MSKGTRASAILYSLVETAKVGGLDDLWLTCVFKHLQEMEFGSSVEHPLLPKNMTPDEIKS